MVFRNILHFYIFILDIIKSRRMILELSKKDFQSRYLGSYLGIVWAFANPLIYIGLLWFVFQFGFRSAPVDNFPYILWLSTSLIIWFFFSDCISTATTSVIEYSYLVKNVVFRLSILPIVKILSAFLIHLVFIAFLFVIFFFYGYYPHIYAIQIPYYLFAGAVLILGLSWITASLIIFLKDVGQIVAVFLQFGFWFTPIFWSVDLLPEKYRALVKLNPIYYLVEGYRESFIYNRWFWEDPWLTAYFWAVTLSIFVIGAVLFRKLRPHFADVI